MSPIGELRFTIMFDEFDKTFGGVFPSPIGELHFSIIQVKAVNVIPEKGFRPLSGELHFSIVGLVYIQTLNFKTVSVPYRGATFLNFHLQIYHLLSFPSPIGELHFSILVLALPIVFWQLKFPSPIGELHFSMQHHSNL